MLFIRQNCTKTERRGLGERIRTGQYKVQSYLSEGERGSSDDAADEAARMQHQLQRQQPRQPHHDHSPLSEANQAEHGGKTHIPEESGHTVTVTTRPLTPALSSATMLLFTKSSQSEKCSSSIAITQRMHRIQEKQLSRLWRIIPPHLAE